MTRQNESQLTEPMELREAEITKIAGSKEDVAALRQHLREILESKPFKGSHRSAQFLGYIVNQAIAGRFDALKERLIGIELFGRSPSYDTGEDAIVRVTASDVRRRLLQHYGENGQSSKFRLSIPQGSYIPEITRVGNGNSALAAGDRMHASTAQATPDPREFEKTAQSVREEARVPARWSWLTLISLGAGVIAVNVVLWGLLSYRTPRVQATSAAVLPWSSLLTSSHFTHLITSDPNIVAVQEIDGSEIPVSDYANRKYIPEPNKLTSDELRLVHIVLWGDNSSAAVDPPIAVRIAALAQSVSRTIDARAARSIQLSDLKTDDNFIFLGSPRSNPWSSLFSDQLDFKFDFDKSSGQEIIRNVHPRAQEQSVYVPTAAGWATGRSYAIIAFVQNPDQNGQVLLLAGANGEGTEATGKLVTDLPRLSAALDRCGIHSGKTLQHFEMLLQLNTMAGSPSDTDILACHLLPAMGTSH